MAGFGTRLVPLSQKQSIDDLLEMLDIGRGERSRKVSAYLMMLVLAGVIAVCGVLADSTATVIGAMIIAPLATPILGIALGIVTGRAGLVLRSIGWVLAGVVIVVLLGYFFAPIVADAASLQSNSQVVGRTSPQLLDLVTALATGFAGAFAMCRKDLGAALPGVAISISLVPPLGVVGVCAGQGEWDSALGALLLFLSNVLSLVIAGSIVFTVAGFTKGPRSLPTAKRRRAYTIIAVLTLLVVVPLAINTVATVAYAKWTADIRDATTAWIAQSPGSRVEDVRWTGLTATVGVTTPDGETPPISELREDLSGLPEGIEVGIEVTVATSHTVR